MTLDAQDYKDIMALMQRMEDKIDALRRDFVATNVQALVNTTVDEKFKDMHKRLDKLEDMAGIWVLRAGVIAAFLISFVDMLIGLKVIP